MTNEQKKRYLRTYTVYLMRSQRIREMMEKYPKDAARFEAALVDAQQHCEWIEKEITLVKPEILSEILAQKYLCGNTLEQIGTAMHYSRRQLERLHRKAIEVFTPILPENEKNPEISSLQNGVQRV